MPPRLCRWQRFSGTKASGCFFPLGEIYAALWPSQRVLVFGFDLPLTRTKPPALWHAHEIILGAFGAALIGFITTEKSPNGRIRQGHRRDFCFRGRAWAREPRRRLLGHRPRHRPDRSCGSICDIAWLVLLVACVAWIPLKKRTQKLQGFLIWIAAFAACEIAVRYGMAVRDIELAQQMPYTAGFVFLGLLGLALARITVPVTNLVLDPTETTSPFPSASGPAEPRARPCRAGDRGRSGRSVRGSERLSQIAAGAAFMDRVGKAFIGRAGLRAETMVPALSSFLAGSGLVVIGIARLAASFPEAAGLHAALMGLGLGVLAVFSIAGQLHPGQKLRFAAARKLRSLLVGAVAQRVLPDLGLSLQPPGPPHALAALSWAATFLLWLKTYWPALSDADTPVGENLLKNAGAAYPFARDLQSCCAAPSIRHVPACHLDDDFTDGSDETAMPFS